MQFLKILFWCLLAFLAAVFTAGNWRHVELHLSNEVTALVNLPLLLLAMFLAGFVPMLIYHQVTKWRLRQRLSQSERALADLRALPVAAAERTPPVPVADAMPPAAVPTAVPPGVS